MVLGHVPSTKAMPHPMFTGFSRPMIDMHSCTNLSAKTKLFFASTSLQSILISILCPSGSRTHVDSPLPFDPLLTSAGEGSIPLRLNVAITS
jgi:hypothetical protein